MLKHVALHLALAGFVASAVADEVTYREHIQPLWDAQCATCHGEDSPELGRFKENSVEYEEQTLGPRMLGYAELTSYVVWPETGALMRRLDDGSGATNGQPGNMYEHLGRTEEERQANLALFKAWVGEDAWVHNRWNARGEVEGITKEQIDQMLLKY